ncbi:signal transducer and activator of transcription 5B-like [Hydractinia symbiolongicarpus]|uniref:signal transducer and activator of transcription 5B-like n=1 Tax=Hydractinia symbiolongicarpus TaxID=13093 RepID=UPI00254BB0F0|nr:signal transducer and activator of transcription 5B-like [Hydractinia symbiolongicarpus]
MGIWNDLRSLGEDYLSKLQELYMKRNFPWEVRGNFADWFEEQNWNFDEKSHTNVIRTQELLDTLLKKLDDLCAKPHDDLMNQMRLYDIRKQFVDTYGGKPELFVATVRDILNEEQQLLALKSMSSVTLTPVNNVMVDQVLPPPPAIQPDIRQTLHELKSRVMDLDSYVKEYRNRQEDFILQYQDVCKVENDIQQLKNQALTGQREQQTQMMLKRKQEIESVLRGKAEQLLKDRENIITSLINIQQQIEVVGSRIVEELLRWRMMQQKSLSGAPKPGALDEIQEWFENLTDILWHFYSLAAQYKLLFDTLPITKYGIEKEQIEKLLKDVVTNLTTLIMRSFIVDKQPPQVLKTQTKFQASVRLLVGSKLNLQMNCPEVTVSILSEKQCKDLVQGKKLEEIGTCGDILNEKCVMEHNKDRTTLQAEFKNLQLKKIKRQDRKGQESVLEAKSALVFSAKLNISGDELPVLCMSVPVVVVVHGNQGPNSEATIIWDNMFSSPDREPFDVPEEVAWKEMSVALNARWMMTTEHELHYEHLLYLREKISSNVIDHDHITSDSKVPWALFNKEPLKGRTFTFWEWFHGAIEVVRKNLRDHWKDQCLEFMSRQTAHAKLLEKPPGTFLIRFSDGELGAVTIAWCCERNGRRDIWYLQPWSTKDFTIRGLADRIFDIPELTHLFPDIPKERAFGRFRSIEVPTNPDTFSGGYVGAGIIARILPSINTMNQFANSPQPVTPSNQMEINAMGPVSSPHEPVPYSPPPVIPSIGNQGLSQSAELLFDENDTNYQRMFDDVTTRDPVSNVETFTHYLLQNN